MAQSDHGGSNAKDHRIHPRLGGRRHRRPAAVGHGIPRRRGHRRGAGTSRERRRDADGTGTYELFSAVWPGQSGEFADRMNSIRKYVFSATLDEAAWNNSVILRGDAVAEVTRLKQQDGGELALYGHGRLAQALLEHGLVDELRLSVHPVLVGSGQVLFRDGQKQALEFAGAKTFGTGVVVLTYHPAAQPG